MSYKYPYKGIRVLDVSQGFAGPYVGGMLSLYGASVIKVEPPEGDWVRIIGKAFGGNTPLGVVANRGKRSIAINLKTDAGRALVHQMAETADVFLESFRPGVAARLGIGYPDIKKINPRVIYLSVSGFGQDGPDSGRPATDTVIQANSGFMSANEGMDGIPHKASVLIADTSTGIYGFQAVAAALFARQHESEGLHLDVSLMQSTAAFVAPKVVEYHVEDGAPRLLNAPAGSYQTQDGWLAVTLVKEHHFEKLCQAIDQPALVDDPRFANFDTRAEHIESLKQIIGEALLTKTTDEWVDTLTEHEVLCSPIADFGDWLADPQAVATHAAPDRRSTRHGADPHSGDPGYRSGPRRRRTARRPVDRRTWPRYPVRIRVRRRSDRRPGSGRRRHAADLTRKPRQCPNRRHIRPTAAKKTAISSKTCAWGSNSRSRHGR